MAINAAHGRRSLFSGIHAIRGGGEVCGGQKRVSAYWCSEGSPWGHISYIDAQGALHENVLNIPANSGMTPGRPLQYATFYDGKIYAVSKQAKTSNSERLLRINPATWEIEKMGGAGFDGMAQSLFTHHFLGVSDKVGYLSSSDAKLFKINLKDLSAEKVAGAGWDDLSNRRVGNMILCRGRIVVEVYGKFPEHELWVLDVESGTVVEKFQKKGLFNPVVTKDGRLLAVLVQAKGAGVKSYSLVKLDMTEVNAEPRVLLEFADDMRPADF